VLALHQAEAGKQHKLRVEKAEDFLDLIAEVRAPSMTMTPKQIETRKRLRDDFDFYCRNCVKIRTKDGTIAPLILNRVQKRFADRIIDQQQSTGKVRFVVVKARQQGLSTVISAWQYWWLSQRKAQKGLVMAHVAESTTTLFDMYHRIHQNVPKIVQPSTKYSSRTELVFSALDSGFVLLRRAAKALLAAKRSLPYICRGGLLARHVRTEQLQRSHSGRAGQARYRCVP
jgi:hypothetical protein